MLVAIADTCDPQSPKGPPPRTGLHSKFSFPSAKPPWTKSPMPSLTPWAYAPGSLMPVTAWGTEPQTPQERGPSHSPKLIEWPPTGSYRVRVSGALDDEGAPTVR